MVGQVLRLLAAVLVVNGLLLSAQWFFPTGVWAPWVALEAGFVVGLALLLPRTRGSWLAALGLAVAVGGMTVLGFSEAAARIILARPLNLYLDFPLAGSNLRPPRGHSWTLSHDRSHGGGPRSSSQRRSAL